MGTNLRFLALSLVWSSITFADPDAACYQPDGKYAPGYYPCDPNAYITNCCPQGYTCYSNSLCVVNSVDQSFPNLTVGTAIRGACTNPRWVNAICGDYCLLGENGDTQISYDHKLICRQEPTPMESLITAGITRFAATATNSKGFATVPQAKAPLPSAKESPKPLSESLGPHQRERLISSLRPTPPLHPYLSLPPRDLAKRLIRRLRHHCRRFHR